MFRIDRNPFNPRRRIIRFVRLAAAARENKRSGEKRRGRGRGGGWHERTDEARD